MGPVILLIGVCVWGGGMFRAGGGVKKKYCCVRGGSLHEK